MPRLYGRTWRIRIADFESRDIEFAFDVEKSLQHTPNKATVTVYNLSSGHRRQLEQLNVYSRPGATGGSHRQGRIRVEVEVGYGTNTFLLFRGDLRTALSERPDDWVTKIEGEDGGRSVLWSRVNRSYQPNTPVFVALRDCAQAMGVGIGNLTDYQDVTLEGGSNVFTMGTVLSGSAPDELQGLCRSLGLTYSVQNGVLQFLRRGQALQTQTVVLRAGTGLVDLPTRQPDGTIVAKALIQPELYPGRQVNIDTDSVRGFYRIHKAKYAGDTSAQDWYVTLECREIIPVSR